MAHPSDRRPLLLPLTLALLALCWAPASPDISGLNWEEESAPYSTAATKSTPWVAHVTSGGRSGPPDRAAGSVTTP